MNTIEALIASISAQVSTKIRQTIKLSLQSSCLSTKTLASAFKLTNRSIKTRHSYFVTKTSCSCSSTKSSNSSASSMIGTSLKTIVNCSTGSIKNSRRHCLIMIERERMRRSQMSLGLVRSKLKTQTARTCS